MFNVKLTSLPPPRVMGLVLSMAGAATAPVAALMRLEAERERRPRKPLDAVEKSCWYVDK